MTTIIRNYLIWLMSISFLNCGFISGNTVREYNDKCYKFAIRKIDIVSICKNTEYRITEIKIILIDSISLQYKELVFIDSLPTMTDNYHLNVSETTRQTIQKEYVKILLMTERPKTWYDITISPSDWRNSDYKFLVKNVW